jgi:hypothetical protein
LPIAIDASSRNTPILRQELLPFKTRSRDFYHGLIGEFLRITSELQSLPSG